MLTPNALDGLRSNDLHDTECAKTARGKLSGDIVKTTLCEENGGFVYRLLIREPAGRLVNRTVDARLPFPP